jgi:hypothetical protein
MSTPTAADLYTTVVNNSGVDRTFSFLGVHGRRLGAAEAYTEPGNLLTKLAVGTSRRKFNALARALTGDSGQRTPSLTVVSTPPPVLNDPLATDPSKVPALRNGVLGIIDPSWEWGVEEGSSVFASA